MVGFDHLNFFSFSFLLLFFSSTLVALAVDTFPLLNQRHGSREVVLDQHAVLVFDLQIARAFFAGNALTTLRNKGLRRLTSSCSMAIHSSSSFLAFPSVSDLLR